MPYELKEARSTDMYKYLYLPVGMKPGLKAKVVLPIDQPCSFAEW
jgi:hypothetical protein